MTLPLRLVAGAVLLFTAMIALGFAVNAGWFRAFDIVVSNMLNLRRGFSPDWLILAMQAISWIGGGLQRYIMVVLLTVALWRWWGWRAGLAMGLTTLVSAFTSDTLKVLFARVRPELVMHLDAVSSPAYPSGHSANAAVVYILFIMLVPQARHSLWQLTAAILIVLTGLSRIMLGVHWPTDVIGGWLLGAAFAMLCAAIIAQRERTRLGPLSSALAP